MQQIRWKWVAAWWGLAVLGISAMGGVLWLAGGSAGGVAGVLIAGAAMFSPLLATILVERLAPRSGELGAMPRFGRWLAVASAVPLLLTAGAVLVAPVLPGVVFDPSVEGMLAQLGGTLTPEQYAEAVAQLEALPVHPLLLAIPQAVIAGASINALFAFAEEIGWRGWLQRELAPLGFWGCSGVTGVLWGLWHAPLILQGHNYPDHPVIGVFLFTVVTVLLSPLLSWVRLRGGTVWTAAVFHGTFNASAGIAMLAVAGSDLLIGLQGLAGVVVLLVANGALLAIEGRNIALEAVRPESATESGPSAV